MPGQAASKPPKGVAKQRLMGTVGWFTKSGRSACQAHQASLAETHRHPGPALEAVPQRHCRVATAETAPRRRNGPELFKAAVGARARWWHARRRGRCEARLLRRSVARQSATTAADP